MIALPLGIIWVGALVLAVLDGTRRPIGWLGVGILVMALGAVGWVGLDVLEHGRQELVLGGWDRGIGIALRVDELGLLFAALSLVVIIAALIYEVIEGVKSRIFPALIAFMALGLTGLFFTGDAFNFYVFFEIAMISAYILAGYGETPRQFRSAFIFTVVNFVGSVFFLIGIAGVYHITGWLDMVLIAEQMPLVAPNPSILSAGMIFMAFGIKLGLLPFHFWLPAVYTGTRPAVAAILSGALANIGTYGLLRFGADMFTQELQVVRPVILTLAAISIVYGGIQAIARHNPSEALAYSAIGQVGYILIALAIGGPVGYSAAIVYAVINSLNKTLLFLSVSLRGRFIGAAFAVGSFSVAGVPPVAGFLGKFALFRVGVAEDMPWVIGLVFAGGALSFIYMFQYYRRRHWWRDTEHEPESSFALQGLVVVLAILIIGLGLFPEPLLQFSERAASVLPER